LTIKQYGAYLDNSDPRKKPPIPAAFNQYSKLSTCRLDLVSVSPMEPAPCQPKPKKTRTKFTSFLGCFGFSRKAIPSPTEKPTKKKQTGLFSWSWVCVKNSGAKTVPIDSTVPGSDRTTGASKPKRQKPLTKHETPRQTPARVSSDRAPKEMPGEVCEEYC